MKAFNKRKINPRKIIKFKLSKNIENKKIVFNLKNGHYRLFITGKNFKITNCSFENVYNKIGLTVLKCENVDMKDCIIIGKKVRYKKLR